MDPAASARSAAANICVTAAASDPRAADFARGTVAAALGLSVGYVAQYAFNVSAARLLGRDGAGVLFSRSWH